MNRSTLCLKTLTLNQMQYNNTIQYYEEQYKVDTKTGQLRLHCICLQIIYKI